MRVVCVQGRTFGRSRDTNEFTDVTGAGWQMTKPQYTSLYANSLEEHHPLDGNRIFKVWTETRRIANNDLLAIHTLDNKLGKWFPSQPEALHLTPLGAAASLHPIRQSDSPTVIDGVAITPEVPADSKIEPAEEQAPATQKSETLPNEALTQSITDGTNGLETVTADSMPISGGNDTSIHLDRAAGDSILPLHPPSDAKEEKLDATPKFYRWRYSTD
jgi:hypothetical protein